MQGVFHASHLRRAAGGALRWLFRWRSRWRMSAPLRRLQQAPRHLLVCEKGHVRHARSRHAAHVRDHAYNCRVSAGGGSAARGMEARPGAGGRDGRQRAGRMLASGLP